MVYCSKCGTNNEEGTQFCTNCGASLYPGIGGRGRPKKHEKREAECFGQSIDRETECFGLPRGGVIFGLIIGIVIILAGINELFGLQIDYGPFAIIVVGILFVVGAIYGLSRKRS